jgi:hypothetical protein
VTTIGSYAFYNWNSLSSVVIPARVNDIGIYAFASCENLKSIIFTGLPPYSVGASAFPSITGYFSSQYTTQWNGVLNSNGRWNNLQMIPLNDMGGDDSSNDEGNGDTEEDTDDNTTNVLYFRYSGSNGEITITGLNSGYPSTIKIPSTINGYPVTAIGANAFRS